MLIEDTPKPGQYTICCISFCENELYLSSVNQRCKSNSKCLICTPWICVIKNIHAVAVLAKCDGGVAGLRRAHEQKVYGRRTGYSASEVEHVGACSCIVNGCSVYKCRETTRSRCLSTALQMCMRSTHHLECSGTVCLPDVALVFYVQSEDAVLKQRKATAYYTLLENPYCGLFTAQHCVYFVCTHFASGHQKPAALVWHMALALVVVSLFTLVFFAPETCPRHI